MEEDTTDMQSPELNDYFFFRAVNFLSKIAGFCSAFMTLAAVIITCQMIFVRFVLNQSTVWQTEAVIYLIIGATLIGLPFVQRMRGHVNVDLIPLALPMSFRYWLAILTLSVSAGVIAIMLWYSYEYWYLAFSKGWRSDSVWGVQLWIPYSSLLVGFALLFLQLIADLIAVIMKIEKPFGLGEN